MAGGMPMADQRLVRVASAGSQRQGEYVAVGEQGSMIGEEEEPLAASQLGACTNEVLHSFRVGRNRQDAEPMEAETAAMKVLRPSGFVGEEFAKERTLPKVLPDDRHGGSLSLQEKVSTVAVGGLVEEFQGKDTVWDHAQFSAGVQIHGPPERLPAAARLLRQRKLVCPQQPHPAMSPAGGFERHHHVSGEEGVFQEQPADGAIPGTPIEPMGRHFEFLLEQDGSLVAQPVNHRLGTTSVVVVNLGARAFEEAVMVEQLKPAQDRLRTPADQRGDVGGTQKAMPVDVPNDLPVALSELDRRNLAGADEAGKTE
jgi:hypothetical protein